MMSSQSSLTSRTSTTLRWLRRKILLLRRIKMLSIQIIQSKCLSTITNPVWSPKRFCPCTWATTTFNRMRFLAPWLKSNTNTIWLVTGISMRMKIRSSARARALKMPKRNSKRKWTKLLRSLTPPRKNTTVWRARGRLKLLMLSLGLQRANSAPYTSSVNLSVAGATVSNAAENANANVARIQPSRNYCSRKIILTSEALMTLLWSFGKTLELADKCATSEQASSLSQR